jgi:3-oxoadipate enol-lactonase
MRVEANGIRMNYELSGKKEAPVVALSHSLGSSLVMWDPQMESLNGHFQVLRYDTRGHGGTDAPAGSYTLDLLAKDFISLLDALKIDGVHFVGLSLGGMIGQALGTRYADRLQSLCLCDTAASLPKEAQPVWRERIEAARKTGLGGLVEATMERWFTPSYLKKNPPLLGLIRREFLNTPQDGFIGCCEAIRKLDFLPQLAKIHTPTLILVGEDDPGTPVSASREIQERIAGSKLVVLPAARHFTNVEQKDAFNEALLNFLRGPLR